jgi:hypothetical protein
LFENALPTLHGALGNLSECRILLDCALMVEILIKAQAQLSPLFLGSWFDAED